MRNRYGKEYSFSQVDETTYLFECDEEEMKYCRFGGNEGEQAIDYTNLGFFDPSGGPFISRGYSIEGRKVTRIRAVGNKILLEVA